MKRKSKKLNEILNEIIIEKNNRIDNFGFKNCQDLNPFFYISLSIAIFFEILIIYSLYKLKEKKYLKEWFIFVLFLNLSFIITYIISNDKCYNKFLLSIKNPLLTIINIINLIMLIRLFLYIQAIDKKQLNEKIIYWYLIISFAFMMFFFIYLITLFMVFQL